MQRTCLGVLHLLFLEAQALCIATQNIFRQIEKLEEIIKYKEENFMSFITL